jgi:putative ABC transport system permease protein
MWQAGSFKLGMLFIGTFAAAFILLRGGSWLVMQLMKVLPRMRSLAFRQGLANLGRPGNQTHTIVFSIGLGVTIILTIYLVQISLIREIRDNIPTDAPSLFFIDIQPDQKNPFETLLTHQGSTISHTITPIVRSRLHSINGKTIAGIAGDKPNGWYFTREYVLTFQKDMPIHNTIKKGKWWRPEGYGGRSLISVEEDAARGLGIDLGSTIVFDIQGTLVQATVSSIRGVDWGSMTTNFYIIFSPGALDGVPMNYIATARLPRAGEMKLQDAIVHSFPNVTAINLRDILETVAGILNRMSQVIRFIAVFSVLAGLIVLSSAISATRLQRIRESVILKTLGATRWMLIRSFAVEYALLGAIGGTIGAGLSLLVAWSVVHYILELHWYFSPTAVLMGILTTILLTLLTGFLTTYRILGQKPLAVLRTE